MKQTYLFAGADNILTKVFAVMETDVAPPGRAVLQAQVKALEDVKQKMVEAEKMTSDAVALDKSNAVTHRAEGQAKNIEVMERIQGAKNLVAELDSSAPQSSGAASLGGSRPRQMMYKKRPFPKFDGKRRNYPRFRREWSETVTNQVASEFDLRLIRDNVPAQIQPDIKNLRKISEVWEVLDEEYGQVMELTAELIEDLTSFQFSKEAKTEDAKFAELYRIWQQVIANLVEVGRTDILDHEPTLSKFAKGFQALPKGPNTWS